MEFHAGDEVPVEFAFESRWLDFKAGPLVLVAKRTFFVLIRPGQMPLLSEDGENFQKKSQNSFALGLSMKKGEALKVSAAVRFRADP